MENKDVYAFDLGGVLAYQDFSKLTEEESYLFKAYMNRFNTPISDELLHYAKSKMRDIFVKVYVLNPSTIPTLEMLKDDEIKSSIWTNSTDDIEAWFESINLYNYIKRENIVNSYYLSANKPDRRFYEEALKIVGSRPSDVLFFDDSMPNIVVALNLGIRGRVYSMESDLKEVVRKEYK